MRAVVQRVKWSKVSVGTQEVSKIGKGLMVLIGVENEDGKEDVQYLANKIAHLRIFPDENYKMNLSVLDIGGEIQLVSQFTLHGDARKGRRPSFIDAMEPTEADALFQVLVNHLKEEGLRVVTGSFGAQMDVELCNWGPVTILLDSKKTF